LPFLSKYHKSEGEKKRDTYKQINHCLLAPCDF